MSGHSTLRLCFAAMAPALTEAATARLKLQDPNDKHNSRTAEKDYETAKVDRVASFGKKSDSHSFHFRDFKNSDDIAELASLAGNGTHGDTVSVRSSPKGKGGGLTLTPVLPKHVPGTNTPVTIGRLTAFTVNGKHFTSLIDVKQETKTASFLEGLKRMNQAHLGSDQREVKKHFIVSSNSSADQLRILASKVSKSGMVNGDNGFKKEEQPVKLKYDDDGDTLVRKGESKKLISQSGNKSSCLKSSISELHNTMGMSAKNKLVLTHYEDKSDTVASSVCSGTEKSCDEVRKECVKKQAYLERKIEMLIRRLKRVKGKVVESHTKEQLVQYVNFQHRNLQMVAKSIKSEAPCPEVLKEHFLSNEDVKNMSTSQLVKLVRDHQSNKSLALADNGPARFKMINRSAIIMSPALQAESCSSAERLSLRVQAIENDLDSDATASSSGGESDEDSSTVPLDVALPSLLKRAEWKWAVDRSAIVARWTWLQAQVSDLEYRIRQQSQVHRQLRNSKGGVVLGEPPTAMDILRKLQGLKTSQEGSAPDSKTSEGSSASEVSPCNVSALMSNVDKQASRLTQSLNCLSPAASSIGSPGVSKLSSPVVNSVGNSPSSSSISCSETTRENSPLITSASLPGLPLPHTISESYLSPTVPVDSSCQSARCRPLRSYRKRKILRTIDLYKTSVKAARLSDVRCRCGPPSNPCAMCGGRYNNTLPMEADTMSFNEKVALLDPSFHPVLSFPEDIPLSIHCEGVLKSGLWQNKSSAKRSRASDCRRQKAFSLTSTESLHRNQTNKIQNGRASTSNSSVINVTTKIKNKYEGKTKAKNAISRTVPFNQKANKVKRKADKIAKALKKKKDLKELEALFLDQDGTNQSLRDGLSNSSQSGFKDLKDGQAGGNRRRRAADNSAFDINNIEIPHSIAASTRVEQIQYKEIVTPKWRVVDGGLSQEAAPLAVDTSVGKQLEKTNGILLSLEHTKVAEVIEEEIEDCSDEAYLTRHSLPEQEEMKRFRNFLQYPPTRRGRARSDAFLSLSDKENFGKSDLLAIRPYLDSVPEGGDKEITPASRLEEKTSSSSAVLNKSLPGYLPASEDSSDLTFSSRRRTMSGLRRERTSSGAISDHCLPEAQTEPWQPRVFPLSEDEYSRMQNELSFSSSNCEPLHRQMDHQLAEPSGKVFVGNSGVENQEDGFASRQESRAASPQPSNESLSSVGDDPADPDWLANLVESKGKNRNCAADGGECGDPDWTGSDTPRKGRKR